ncbi:MAG TPA: MotA/TolQ/ExbB proton channel family protein [Bacteroidales bacterium]|nr:MotA/TolQ/ExbB proton channel family protein [Bacteroidales bacterium]
MILLDATTVAVTKSESMIDIMLKGGWILVPIFLMSIFAVYYMVERYTVFQHALKVDKNIVDDICGHIKHGNLAKAHELASGYNHPIGRVIVAGLSNPARKIEDIEQIMAEETKNEIFILEKNLGYLGSIATIAPMFGFLGTIFGVIKIFYNISLADNISIGLIAGGLYQKMVSSAAGLTVGIFTYAGYYYLNNRVDVFVNRMERNLSPVVNAIRDSRLS